MTISLRRTRVGVWAVACALVGVMLWAPPAHAQTMYLDFAQGRLPGNWDDCMARARRALPAESWAIGGEYGAPERGGYFVAWKGQHGAILVCDIEPAGGSIFHLTISGLDEGNLPLVEALSRQMREGTAPPPLPPPVGRGIDWGYSPQEYRGQVGQQFTYMCAPNGSFGRVWGTDVYTDDSSLCTAAVHSGLATVVGGGTVTIEMLAGQSAYAASTRNGVTTSAYGAWSGSFRFVR